MDARERWVVVGGGVLGTVTALSGVRAGHDVLLLEENPDLGGLTATQDLPTPHGPVTCDRFYHVILESDRRLRALLTQLGLEHTVRWTSAPAVVAAQGRQYPATSLVDMATLPALGTLDRARTGLSVAASLLLPRVVADRLTALSWLRGVAGTRATASFWHPILRAKLGTQAEEVTATFVVSTFRRLILARLTGAGDRFGVLPHGYGPVFAALRQTLVGEGARLRAGTAVTSVRRPRDEADLIVTLSGGELIRADRVILTTPGPVTARLLPDLSPQETRQLTGSPYLGVICASLLLRHRPNDAYITYLTDDVGITGVIGMHALTDPADMRGLSLVYLPRYCAPNDPWFDETDETLLERLLDAARRSLPQAPFEVVTAAVNRARYVVPLPTPQAPPPLPFSTSIPGVHVISAAQNTSGTLNVEGTLAMAASALSEITKETRR